MFYFSVNYKFLKNADFVVFGSFAIFAPVKAQWKVPINLFILQSKIIKSLSLVTLCTFLTIEVLQQR